MMEIKVNASCFIIPNRLGVINDNLIESYRDKEFKKFQDILKLNAIKAEIDPDKTRLVQLWFHSEELGTDNLVRHGGTIHVGESKILVHPDIEVLPAFLFKGCNEGETMNLKVPAGVKDADIVLDMTIKVCQLSCRYHTFGRFDEVLESMAGIKKIPAVDNGVLKFAADGFIVPNHADTIDEIEIWKEDVNFVKYMDDVCRLNGYGKIDVKKDRLVDIWMSSDDVQCGNLSDHQSTIINKDGEKVRVNMYYVHRIPAKILQGHREDDTFTFKAPLNIDNFHRPADGDIIMEIQLSLKQLQYRYRRFGKFEEVLERVTM